jgi:hypothetical protein
VSAEQFDQWIEEIDRERTAEPPAEAQQDEVRDLIALVIGAIPHRDPCDFPDHDCGCNAAEDRRSVVAALAARPSADTETLRRVRELVAALETVPRKSQWLHIDALRAALDRTQ